MCLTLLVMAAALILAPTARAQTLGGISGGAVDETGGVLPGVTVEASSPALLEGARTAVTDGQGRYNIISLRPGTYSVTFSLPGFSTVIREGVELSGEFTANIDVQMVVGGVQETITVTGRNADRRRPERANPVRAGRRNAESPFPAARTSAALPH